MGKKSSQKAGKPAKPKSGKSTGPKKKAPKETARAEEAEKSSLVDSLPPSFRPYLPWAALVLLMLVGLYFRLAVTLWQPLIYPDSMQYMHLAQEIRSGEFFSADYDLDEGFIKSRHLPPFYSLLISPFAATQADLEKVGIIISLSLSVLVFVPLFLASKRIFGTGAALVGAGLLTFHNFATWYAYPILSESTFTFLSTCALASGIWLMTAKSKKSALIAGATAGFVSACMYMTRDVGIAAAPIIAFMAFIKFKFADRQDGKRSLVAPAVLVIVFLTASSPYFIHIRVRTGSWGLTAQMDNTNISQQVYSMGGTRWDRDKMAGESIKDLSTADAIYIVGAGAPANSGRVLGISSSLSRLAVKLFRNLRLYGEQLVQRNLAIPTALILVAFLYVLGDYLITRRLDQLIVRSLPFIWGLHLWAIYSLVTPYMVDDRYMYPISLPYALLAGAGIYAAARLLTQKKIFEPADHDPLAPWIAPAFTGITIMFFAMVFYNSQGSFYAMVSVGLMAGIGSAILAMVIQTISQKQGPALIASIAFPLIVLAFYTIIPAMSHRFTTAHIQKYFEDHQALLTTCKFPGMILLFAVSSVFTAERILSKYKDGPISFSTALTLIAAPILVGAIAAFAIPANSSFSGVALALIGFGLAFLASYLISRQTSRKVLVTAICLVFVLSAYAGQYFDQRDLRFRKGTLSNKYSAGHKQLALELKQKGLVPPGSIICSRKPFMAYYLDGDWYIDKDKQEPIPKTVEELEELIATEKIDYIVTDSFTFRTLRKRLTPIALGLQPVKGAAIIHSKYFRDYGRVITVYKVGAKDQFPRTLDPVQLANSARRHYYNGNYPFALRDATIATKIDPNNVDAALIKFEILLTYYDLTHHYELPNSYFAPMLMPAMLETIKSLRKLLPDDPNVNQRYQEVLRAYAMEEKKINALREKYSNRNR
jgi:MFS family permease